MKKDHLKSYLMISPAFLGICLFVVYPMISLIGISFTNYDLVRGSGKFVKLANYEKLFSQPAFGEILSNTLIYTFYYVVLTMSLALFFAFLVQRSNWFDRFVQGVTFLPHITAMVSVSLVWMWLMDPFAGFLNYILEEWFHVKGLQWLQSSSTAMMSVIIINVWKSVGYYTLIILSALKTIPADIYEAADLDHSTKLRTFFKITIPMISPTLFFLLVVMTISSFNVFDSIKVLTGGGPVRSTMVLVYYIYEYAFIHMRLGYAAAAGTVQLIIVSFITFIYFKLLQKRIYYK
jgi:sn-glycerol 3-phosphate transport system permease protein